MRTINSTLRFALIIAGLAFFIGCDDTQAPTIDGPAGTVGISIAPLVFPEITGATFEFTIVDSLDVVIYHNPSISSDEYGTPDGRVLFVAPCSAGNGTNPGMGPPGTEINTVTVRLIEVRAEGGQVFTLTKGDAIFPPALSRDVVCVENQEVRAEFLLTIARRAQQGFVDMVVQIQDVFCSYKLSCEQELMADPEPPYAPGPTLVTGITCTDGEPTLSGAHFVGFEGVLCCDGAMPGNPSCTTLSIDPMTGGAIWSEPGLGVLDVQSYRGVEQILGKVFHNTSWRLDPDAVEQGCVFYGNGFFNWSDDGTTPSYDYFAGSEGVSPAPGFAYRTVITAANEDGEMFCVNPNVRVYFGTDQP